ncbi:MAG: aminodeoxychorismate synthase component I, partial [Flavobacterium sp.]
MRKIIKKNIDNPNKFKEKLLFWAQQFNEVILLDSNNIENTNQLYPNFDFVLAIDAFTSIKSDTYNLFEHLKEYQKNTKDWLFGSITFDAKNDIENLKSNNEDFINFPDLFFFQPKKIFFFKNNLLEIQYLNLCEDEMEEDIIEILNKEIKFTTIEKI